MNSIIGIGVCRPEADVFGMPGWNLSSWGYHGDDGFKFHSVSTRGLRYADTYSTDDTVGCGVDMQTGKLFFTKNGLCLGMYRRPK